MKKPDEYKKTDNPAAMESPKENKSITQIKGSGKLVWMNF